MEVEKYIFPIYSGGTIVGQGFIADGYFITAAHVVKDFPSCFTRINSKRFDLSDALISSSFFNELDVYKNIKKELCIVYAIALIIIGLFIGEVATGTGDWVYFDVPTTCPNDYSYH